MPPTAHAPAPELRRNCPAPAGATTMPVPPLAMGTVPVRLMLGLAPPLEDRTPEAPTLSTPVLFKVSEPPSATVPPPLKPDPEFTVSDEFCSMALVTPLFGMLMVPAPVIGPPVNPAPVFTLVTVPVPGKVCPLAKVMG